MNIESYINPELLVLVPALYLVGMGLKNSALPDKWIPALLGALSILLCTVWTLTNAPLTGWKDLLTGLFTGFVQGILTAGASVYAHQLIKQAGKEE